MQHKATRDSYDNPTTDKKEIYFVDVKIICT